MRATLVRDNTFNVSLDISNEKAEEIRDILLASDISDTELDDPESL